MLTFITHHPMQKIWDFTFLVNDLGPSSRSGSAACHPLKNGHKIVSG